MLLSGLFDKPRQGGSPPPPPRVVRVALQLAGIAAAWAVRGVGRVLPTVIGRVVARWSQRLAGEGVVLPVVSVSALARPATFTRGRGTIYPVVIGAGQLRTTVYTGGLGYSRGVRPLLVDDSDEAILLAIALRTM